MSEASVIHQAEAELDKPAQQQLELPPGFRFHPTDEEVVSHYLTPKAVDPRFTSGVIGEVDLNKCEPWDLPGMAKMGEKEWYFFCHKDRKYPTGTRTNRATGSGYWKATGKDKEIFRGRGVLIGMKKTLVFYLGRAPRGEKTPWVMHEFRLEGKLPHHLPRSAKDEWAVSKVFNKDLLAKNAPPAPGAGAGAAGLERSSSLVFLDEFLDTAELPPLMDAPFAADFDAVVDFKRGMAAAPDAGWQVKVEQPVQQTQQQPLYPSPYYFSLPAASSGYLHQEAAQPAIRRYCKAEPSRLSPSRETGLSSDRSTTAGADISSKQYLVLDDLCSDPVMDLDNIWKY